jgi:spore coat protein CotH
LLSEQDLALLDQSPGREEYVEGSLVFEGQTVQPVGIRYKGNWGAFSQCAEYLPGQYPAETPLGPKTCTKLSIKVAINFPKDSGALFYGLKKLQFHAMNADNSLMRERLGYALFNEMNVPAPRVVHARLLVNGRLEGLFALVEQIDGRFTRGRFTDGGAGNLYKEIWPKHSDPQAYINALESNTAENPSAERILRFKAAIESGNGVDAIDGWMDLEHQMRYIAVDRTIENDDGIFHWWCNETGMGRNPAVLGDPNAHGNHNYYWYEETNADRLWLIPWDLDFAFRGDTTLTPIMTPWNETNVECVCGGNPVVPQMPPGCDRLTQHWATLYDRYLEYVREFLQGPFNQQNVNAKLDRWAVQVDAAVQEQAATTHNGTHLSYEMWQLQLNDFRNQIIPDLRNQS